MGMKISWLKNLALRSSGLKCHVQTISLDISTLDFSTPDFSSPFQSHRGLGLRSPGLKLGVENSRVGMSCNHDLWCCGSLWSIISLLFKSCSTYCAAATLQTFTTNFFPLLSCLKTKEAQLGLMSHYGRNWQLLSKIYFSKKSAIIQFDIQIKIILNSYGWK